MTRRRARRGRSEGTVFQRTDGLWVAAISLGYNSHGKRNRRTVYAKTKSELLTKLRRLQHDMDRGRLVDPVRMTVADFLDMWLAGIKATVAPLTHAYYEKHVRVHLKPHIGDVRLDRINSLIVKGLYAKLSDVEVSPASQNKIGTTLGVALAHAVEAGLIPHNPARDVKKPRAPKFESIVWTAKQLVQFLGAVKNDRLYPLFVLAVDAGMRQGELFGLLWRDVDFDACALNVSRSLQELKGEFTLKETKTKAGRRRVPMSPTAVTVLHEHRKAMLVDGHYAPDRPVFCTPTGKFIDKANFHHYTFSPAIERASVPRVTFHSLRHFHATALL